MGLGGWLLIGGGAVLGLIGLVALLGSLLPRVHVVARSVQLGQPPETVWQVVTDFATVPSWHPGVRRVERLPDRDGREVWRETYKGGPPLQLETVEAGPPYRLVRSIADANLPFRGQWEFEIAPAPLGSRITITERGEVPNPLFRFLARVVLNPAAHLEAYLRALARKFDEPVIFE